MSEDKPANAKQKVDSMLKTLRKGKEIHDQFAQAIQDRILVNGKTMEQWRKHFYIDIPDNADITECKALGMKLMTLYQEAAHYKGMAESNLILSKKGYDSQYRQQFESVVSENREQGKKLPAKDTLETLAKFGVDDLETSVAFDEMAVRFWKEILEKLNYLRKIVETATINNSVEAKMTENKF